MNDLLDRILCEPDRYIIDEFKLLMEKDYEKLGDKAVQAEYERLTNSLSTEITYQRVCEYNYHESNILEAAYQVYQAAKGKKPYHGIDCYEEIIGKKIVKVLIEKPKSGKVLHDIIINNSTFCKCFYSNIYIAYDGGILIATPYVEFWTDQLLPNTLMLDISDQFGPMIGASIDSIRFNHNVYSRRMENCT